MQTRIGETRVWHLGPLDAGEVLIIIGRSNPLKSSAVLDRLGLALNRQRGTSLVWFATRRSETMRRLDLSFDRRFGAAFAQWCERKGLAGRIARKLAYCGLLLAWPARWTFFPALLRFTNAGSARDLGGFLRLLPARRLLLLGHSAGGVIATLAADQPRVSHLICLGYPFRHPQRGEEPERTRHLATMTKPVLILQGDADEYGSAEAARRYRLSNSVTLVPIAANHDYDTLPADEIDRCADLLLRFVASERAPACAGQTGQASPDFAAAAILRSRP